MRSMFHWLFACTLAPLAWAQQDAVAQFYADRLADFNNYLDARARNARNAAEKKAVAAERAACRRRVEAARRGYTGLTESDKRFWNELQAELDAVLNLWQKANDVDPEERRKTRDAANAALLAARSCYEAQLRFVMAQLGLAACSLDADTVTDCTTHFCNELRREYRQDLQSILFAVPWGLENEDEEEEHPHKVQTTGGEEAEEGTVDLHAGVDEELLNTPVAPLMVYELAHESAHTEAARAEAATRATRLWQGYLNLCVQQVVECFGSERGSALVSGVPLPGAVEQSHYAAVQEHAKSLFLEAENAWNHYVEAVVAAHDPGWQAAEGQMAGTPVSAEAHLLRFPLYATHEQYLAFILAPHLQYLEPEPMPDTGLVE